MAAPGATNHAGMTAPSTAGGAGIATPGATAGHDMPAGEGHKESIKEKVRCSCVARLAHLRRQKCPSFWWRLCLLMLVMDVAMCTCIRHMHGV